MKRRIAAFMLVWAYACAVPWLIIATPDASPILLLLPPGYFFVAGFFFAILHEGIATRWPRFWVTTAVTAVALESGVLLHGGHSPGLPLGVLFAIATLCASLTARAVACNKAVVSTGLVLGSLLAICWGIGPSYYLYHSPEVKISPDGALKAWIMMDGGNEDSSLHIGPRYGWNGAFGQTIVQSGATYVDDGYRLITIDTFSWREGHNLYLTGSYPQPLPESTSLLPVEITISGDTKVP